MGAPEALDSSLPGLMGKTTGENSVGEKLLSAIDHTRIPWHDLGTAAGRPSSQLPPVGSTTPEDDDTAPENTLETPHGIVDFLLIANLRTLAAINAFALSAPIFHRLPALFRGANLQDEGGSLIKDDGGGDICWNLQAMSAGGGK